ncbi:DNA polymerase beta domain-containing protein [Thauera phenylacetica B4P]|uniref:DNA polymerase beta domain-containing protein n=1 Tax=Thauera phenylacetica B4P TaxID=1234382 RepID=N6Z1B0_9RHOO|nr:nucleotidyltransferase family protein [Thauera phenylacetica]ENO97655.1 DNA polymerase beta domain-containing protein [Thauera phenylacetica B4P]
MDRDLALQKLTQSKPELHRRFGVVDLALFGSTLRGEARADSDVDVLVRFDGPATSARYFGVQFYLEDLLGAPVDLVTDKALREELRHIVEREAVHV